MFCLLGLLSNGSWLTNFVFGLVSLDSGLLENFFCAIFYERKWLYLSASRTCSMPRQYFFVLIFSPVM